MSNAKKTKAKKTNTDNYRNRNHALLLYPECEAHCQAVEKIKQSYDYAMILHDKDIYTEDEYNADGSIKHKKGELKKPHWHIILRFTNLRWQNALCKDLGLEPNYIREVTKFDNALQYLIHYNDTDKYQYNIDEVQGTLKKRLTESINKIDKSEGEKVSELIDYIESQDEKITIKNFASFCALNGYWAEFRRSATIFIKIIEEHNQRL